MFREKKQCILIMLECKVNYQFFDQCILYSIACIFNFLIVSDALVRKAKVMLVNK